jgi:hypothetical protein
MKKYDEDEYISPEVKVRIGFYILIGGTTVAILVFGISVWILYQQKSKELEDDSNSTAAPSAASLDNNDVSSNTAEPSLTAVTNSN